MTTPYPDAHIEIASSPSFVEAAKRICLEWEKLRILYNGVLISWVVYIVDKSKPALFQSFEFWATCLVGAVVANICFLAGPIVEAYFRWMGVKHWSIRFSLMLIGTLLAGLLASGVMFGMI